MPDLDAFRARMRHVESELQQLRASMEYAYATDRCSLGARTAQEAQILAREHELVNRRRDLQAILTEHTEPSS